MVDQHDNKSKEDKILEDYKKERRKLGEKYLRAELTYTEFYLKVQKLMGKYLDKLNSLPKVFT